MLPIPETYRWSSSTRLMALEVRCIRTAAAPRSRHGSRGSRPTCATVAGTRGLIVPSPPGFPSSVRTHGTASTYPKVRWSTKSSAPSSRTRVAAVCRGSPPGTDAWNSNWPDIPRWSTRASGEPSVASQRNFPRRATSSIVRPAKASASIVGSWQRRPARAECTVNDSMRRPRRWSTSPIRMVSTSGSSGIGSERRGDRLEHGLRGTVLGHLLRGSAARRDELADSGGGEEGAVVVRSAALHLVGGERKAVHRGEFLERCLPVEGGGEPQRVAQEVGEELLHHHPGGLEAVEQVRGADDGLHGVGEDRVLVPASRHELPAPQADVVAQLEVARHLGEGALRDGGRPHLRERPLGDFRMLAEEEFRRHESQDRVTQELQPLVGGNPPGLVGIRPVGERELQDRPVDLRSELLQQGVEIGARGFGLGTATPHGVSSRSKNPSSTRSRGSTDSWAWPGPASASRTPQVAHRPGQLAEHNGWNGRDITTASRNMGSRSSSSPSVWNISTPSSSPSSPARSKASG